MGNKPPSTARCSTCGGLGTVTKGAGRVTCDTCKGAGVVPTS
jgi:DnaJ-class molecular chaperone